MATSRSSRMKLTEETRKRIEREADPVGFLIRVAAGKPFDWGGQKFVPTAKQVIDASLWLGDRTLPKLKEVAVEHGVSDALAERVRAAENKLDAQRRRQVAAGHHEKGDDEVISLNKGGGAVEGVPVVSSSSTSSEKMRPISPDATDVTPVLAGTKDFEDPPGPAHVVIDAELIEPGEKSTAEKIREEHEKLLTSADTITKSMDLADEADIMDELLGGL